MYLRLLLRFQSSEDRLCFSLQVFFFFFFFLMQREACRAGSGRAGPGTTHRLHVILQGGVWLKGLFPNTGLQHSQSWAPLTKPRFFSSLLSLHIWDFKHHLCGSFRTVTRCRSERWETLSLRRGRWRRMQQLRRRAEKWMMLWPSRLLKTRYRLVSPPHIHMVDILQITPVPCAGKLIHANSALRIFTHTFCDMKPCQCLLCVRGENADAGFPRLLANTCIQIKNSPRLMWSRISSPWSLHPSAELSFLPCWNGWKCVLILTEY